MTEAALVDELSKLTVFTDNAAYNLLWHMFDDGSDPDELRATRDKMLMQMARYARAGSPGPLMGWDEVEVTDFARKYEALAEILKAEGPSGSLEQ